MEAGAREMLYKQGDLSSGFLDLIENLGMAVCVSMSPTVGKQELVGPGNSLDNEFSQNSEPWVEREMLSQTIRWREIEEDL